jgi:hypothetical protein
MEPPRLARVVAHSLWLSVAVAAPLLFVADLGWNAQDSDPDLGRGPSGAFLFVLLLSPLWITATLVAGGLTGLAAGFCARLVARVRGGARTQMLAGALASAVVAGLLGLALMNAGGTLDLRWATWVSVLGAAGMVTGGAAVLLAHTREDERGRSPALGWGAAAVVLASASLIGAGWVWLQTATYDVVEDCASRLGVDEFRVAWSEVAFPPQLWCLSGDLVQASVPAWADASLVLGVAATVVCAVAAVGLASGTRPPARSLVAVCVAIGLAGVGGAALALVQQPPADAVARARVAAAQAPPTSPTPRPGSGGVPSATPTVPPPTTVTAAKSALAALSRIARRSDATLVWPEEPHVSATDCELANGTNGTVLSLTGRFTTQDMATVRGPAEVLEVSRANEKAARQLVDDWLTSGWVAGVDILHGEWYLGGPAGGPIESAHVGFTDAVGFIQVTTQCASR